MCTGTHNILIKNKSAILCELQDKWVGAAITIYDSLENDWLYNYNGMLQSVKMCFDDGIKKCLTKLMRPDIPALVALGEGVLTPSQSVDEFKKLIKDIIENAQTFQDALEKYYITMGRVPLANDISVCALYDSWIRIKGNVDDIWQSVWKWADCNSSPIRRYHACNLFIKNPTLIPDESKSKFVLEVLSIICFSEQDKNQWYNPWFIRCELARYYCEYLESKLPGANSEKIASQSWWLADQMGAIYQTQQGNKAFMDQVVEPEEDLMRTIWQLVRLAVSPSVLRYATLYVKNMWSISLISQLGEDTLSLLLSTATDTQKDSLASTITGVLANLFPLKISDVEPVLGFDSGCVGAAQALIKTGYQGERKELLNVLIKCVVQISDNFELETYLKRLPEGNVADQMLIGIMMHLLACLNKAPEQIIWNFITDKDWIKKVFAQLGNICTERFFDALHELQLRNKDKWDEQIPHLYAYLCEELQENKEKQKLLFAFTILSSIAAGSVSAIDRLLKGKNKFDYQDEMKDWRNKIEYIMPYVSEICRARLRGMLASLYI